MEDEKLVGIRQNLNDAEARMMQNLEAIDDNVIEMEEKQEPQIIRTQVEHKKKIECKIYWIVALTVILVTISVVLFILL